MNCLRGLLALPALLGTLPLAAGTGGQHEGLLVNALLANAEGNCPAALMADAIRTDCEQQLPQFRETLTRLGPIKSTTFQGMETLASGPAEIYKVAFEHGDMIWTISTQGDGRIQVLGGNQLHWDVASYSRSAGNQR